MSDDGAGGGPAGPAGGGALGAASGGRGDGRGLLGLRERLALFGGELAAGPRPGGGWRLRAVLPLAEAAAEVGERRQHVTAEHAAAGSRA